MEGKQETQEHLNQSQSQNQKKRGRRRRRRTQSHRCVVRGQVKGGVERVGELERVRTVSHLVRERMELVMARGERMELVMVRGVRMVVH